MEASDEQLFSKGNMLLAAASELAYHTVNCSALNAEELNREQGFIVSKINEFLHSVLHLYFKILIINPIHIINKIDIYITLYNLCF